MIDDERPLRLDAPREEALAHAARLVEDAWRSFDRFRPEEPPLVPMPADVPPMPVPEELPLLPAPDDAPPVPAREGVPSAPSEAELPDPLPDDIIPPVPVPAEAPLAPRPELPPLPSVDAPMVPAVVPAPAPLVPRERSDTSLEPRPSPADVPPVRPCDARPELVLVRSRSRSVCISPVEAVAFRS